MTTALYVRTSTQDQTGEGQLSTLREVVARLGLGDVEVYQDRGHSGAKASRPELDRLIGDVRAGKVGSVYFTAFDRLARNVAHFLRLMGEWQGLGVRVVSLREGVDFGTPVGKMVATIFASVAELERELNRERTAQGIKAARGRGVQWGRPLSRAKWDAVCEALEWMGELDGRSESAAARRAGLSRGTFRRYRDRIENPPEEGPRFADGEPGERTGQG